MIEIETECIKGVIILLFIFFILFITSYLLSNNCATYTSLFRVISVAHAFYDIFTTIYMLVSVNIASNQEILIDLFYVRNSLNKCVTSPPTISHKTQGNLSMIIVSSIIISTSRTIHST